MAKTLLAEPLLAIRLDSSAVGQKCAHCSEVHAQHQPEMFIQTADGWKFICKLCAWDHAPWLVSLINLGHYNDWANWDGVPPSPQALVEKGMTMRDMLGEAPEDPEYQTETGTQEINIAEAFGSSFDEMFFNADIDGHQKAAILENRRTTKRYPASFPALISSTTPGQREETISAMTRDFGDNGIFLDTNHPLPLGTDVKLQMAFPGGETLKLNGTVARCEEHGMAVHFKHSGWEGIQKSIHHFEQAVEGLARAFSKKKP